MRFRENLDQRAAQSVKTPASAVHMVKFLVRDLCLCLHTYIAAIPYRTIWFYAAQPAQPAKRSHKLPKRLKRIQTFPQRFKMLHNAARRSQILLCSCLLTYHTIPYHMGVCLPYNHTHHKNHTCKIGLATCLYRVYHVLQFQTSSFSRCECVSYMKQVGNLYLPVTFGRIQK